jgi:hypothetical protein
MTFMWPWRRHRTQDSKMVTNTNFYCAIRAQLKTTPGDAHSNLSPSSPTTLPCLSACNSLSPLSLPLFYIWLLNIFRPQLSLTSVSRDFYYYLGSFLLQAFSTKSTTEGDAKSKEMMLMTMVAPWRGYWSQGKHMILSPWPPLSKPNGMIFRINNYKARVVRLQHRP